MKFRRHLPESFSLFRWFGRFRPRGTPVAPEGTVPLGVLPAAPGVTHPWRDRLDRLGRWRGPAVNAATFAGAALIGYLVAALLLFRAPIFAATRTVPRVIGLEVAAAHQALDGAKLRNREVDRLTHPTIPAGRVVWQDPPPGVVVTQGTTVDLSVSTGQQRVPVPDIAGYQADLARTLIESAGLAVGTVESSQTSAPKGVVVNTRPSAGAILLPGTRVTLVVSIGAPTITVPDLIGLTLDQARALVIQAGLTPGTHFTRPSTTGAEGTVIEQRPQGGTLSAPEAPVDLILARRAR